MKKAVRAFFFAIFIAVGLVWAHGTYVETLYVERYCAWDWGCWINPFAPDGQSRIEKLDLYNYNGDYHDHHSVTYGGCCSDF